MCLMYFFLNKEILKFIRGLDQIEIGYCGVFFFLFGVFLCGELSVFYVEDIQFV